MPSDDRATIECALKLFKDDEKGCYIHCVLFDFGIQMRAEGKDSDRIIGHIATDLWNVSTLILRLRWMQELCYARGPRHGGLAVLL